MFLTHKSIGTRIILALQLKIILRAVRPQFFSFCMSETQHYKEFNTRFKNRIRVSQLLYSVHYPNFRLTNLNFPFLVKGKPT